MARVGEAVLVAPESWAGGVLDETVVCAATASGDDIANKKASTRLVTLLKVSAYRVIETPREPTLIKFDQERRSPPRLKLVIP